MHPHHTHASVIEHETSYTREFLHIGIRHAPEGTQCVHNKVLTLIKLNKKKRDIHLVKYHILIDSIYNPIIVQV